ncbi:hypothetical protein MYSTI_06754 [Myxococcus stipitatus DSM 14675]|uniref:Porin n=1 Tax=Myxococcus stipitatus (strain DSM 14675 / JCM 12634 / Mx s8) TaxID=1278073 RepID=L7UKG8_MYXSD|nr:hypothetical protein [Myxococcus stipitatus]AGC48027.1 hypothetical protein MYSTI_06754 [Myxococcus stipitatus DSM 14675]
MTLEPLSPTLRRGVIALLSALSTGAWEAQAHPSEPDAPTATTDATRTADETRRLPFMERSIAASTNFRVTSQRMETPTWFFPSALPVQGEERPASTSTETLAIANPADVSVDFNGQTDLGALRLHFNAGFAQPHASVGIHASYAYAQLGGLVAGFADSTFADADAYPGTLDFAGPNALVFQKHAVLRYGHLLNHDEDVRMFLQVALEEPGANLPTGAQTARDPVPDGIVSWRAESDWGHLQLAGVIRAVSSRDPEQATRDTALGLGGNLTGACHLGLEHTLQLGITGGQGIAAYVNELGDSQYDAAPEVDGSLDALPVLGGYAAFTYVWTEMLSSTATYGWLQVWDREHEASLGDTGFRRSQYASLNLVADIVEGTQAGIEGLWGYSRAINNESSHALRVQLAFQYRY